MGLPAAALSGKLVEDHVNSLLAGNLLALHETFALITVITFIRSDSNSHTLYMLILLWEYPALFAV